MIHPSSLTDWFEFIQIASSFAMLGVIWIVQLLVYPAFRQVSPTEFPIRHREHVWRISWIVIPLMLLELSSTLYLTIQTPSPDQYLLMTCTGLAWASTFFIQVPLHERLKKGFHGTRIQRLVRTNWIRTLAWSTKAGALLVQVYP